MSEDAFVEVTGHGSATTTSDRVRIHVAAVAKAPAVRDAFAAADSGLKAMLAAARDHGVADDDLRSTYIDVGAGRRRGRGTGPGFRASMGIEITVYDVAAAGRVLAEMVDAGGDKSRVHRISLAATAPEEALAEARAEAWANALDKARQYARLSGRDLGAVLRVSEAPQGHRYAPEAHAGAADFASVSVEPGSQTVAVATTVRWALL
jgi:uncharacterized protein